MPASVHDYIRRQKARRYKRKLYFYGSGAAAVMFAALYFVFFSGIFVIGGIEVHGADVVSGERVRAVAAQTESGTIAYAFSRAHILFFSSSEAEDAIRAAFPRIASVAVKKSIWHRTIIITVVERQPAGIACEKSGGCVYFDADGTLFASAPSIASASLLRIEENEINEINFPQKKYAPESVAFILAAKKHIVEKTGATVTSFAFVNGYGDVEARTQEGYAIYLSLGQDAEYQVQILKNIMVAEIKDQAPLLEYIDLRVENRAYYKFKQ